MSDQSQVYDQIKSIFPDMDQEILLAVLEANGGRFEETLNSLLEMANDQSSPSLKNSSGNQAKDESAKRPQIEEDELFARALQNEIFMEEMRASGALDSTISNNQGSSSDSKGTNYMETLSNMGEAAKKKINDLYLKFKSGSSFKARDNEANRSLTADYSPLQNNFDDHEEDRRQ